MKFLGDKRLAKYDSDDKDHVFTTFSFCFALDVGFENLIFLFFIQTTVNSYLRVVIIIDQNISILYTLTLFESILALAAIKLFYKENK